MSHKRKALEPKNAVIDKDSVTHYAKKARTWCEGIVSHGLNNLWNGLGLRPLEELAHRQQWTQNKVVGAFPGDFQFSVEGQWHNGYRGDQGDDSDNASRSRTWSTKSGIFNNNDRLGSQESLQRQSSDSAGEDVASYTLGPFSLPSYLQGRATSFWSSRPAPVRSSVTNISAQSRFYKGMHSQQVDNKTALNVPLELRPRIHYGKVGKRTSLLQSKYHKDESTALSRLVSRYASRSSYSPQQRTEIAAMSNQGIGFSDTESIGGSEVSQTGSEARTGSIPSYDNRFRRYGRLRDLLDDQHSDQDIKAPAWMRTKAQVPRWRVNLDRFKNLIAKNLPSIDAQGLSPAHQAAADKHEEIERELEGRKTRARFPPFGEDDLKKVQRALSDGYGPVVDGFNVTITKNDIRTLRPGEWLNDEVINFYGNLIMARSNNSGSLPKVHVFSTFFYKTLSENGYDKVRRWTKKTNIFAKDYLLIPIHCSGNHWTSAVVDMAKKKISYYDSLLGNNPKCFLTLRAYLEKESLDKLKEPFDFQGWENECPKNIPRQQNGYDCGVFTCFFIEFKSRGEDTFNFSQSDMSYLRQKMVLDIINKSV